MRKTILSMLLAFIIPLSAVAMPIPADFSGSRTIGGGVAGTNGSKGPDGWLSTGFKIEWDITQVAGGYNYEYTLDPLGQGGVSHFILEVSHAATGSDFLFPPASQTYGPQVWTDSGNVDLPSDVFGIKFDFGGDPAVFSFFSTKAPVWGDFFAKDGAFGTAWNVGFGTDPLAGPFTDWIATPDTNGTPVPEPGTMMLLGMGMFGLAVYGKRRVISRN